MCWLTLTPAKGKKHRHDHHAIESSCVEELVRVHRSPSPRLSDVRVRVPSSISVELEDHHHVHPHLHHHHKHHLHPLHLHPLHSHHRHHDMPALRLRGPGRKRCPPPPGPPPPSREPSRCRPCSRSSSPLRPREPIYRTQIVEPAQVRETTRVALGTVQPERHKSRLRRVAGYEVLGRDVPWNWDCVSSTVGSSSAGGGKWTRKKGGGLRYPPFGALDRWL
ncbi:uncharacterized protein K460DRAFT_403630 [Cucurbitaria berberidis CBS 394.84]|uniref:Uncharacterized protein n=1 Tax=Cucurbitaria berberidis CBS 394.84 TaxID=1168544 RepID=A0A9P4GN54_9PLEO|nr:uncharacterized protein K460DRAFT_403630 [Cucurbitaria berberidis CBS 394.84]KAF1848341.1 hypothetical protein K460DRAFT_403630 [Cucurbitaria berberidis CBS 394.84]